MGRGWPLIKAAAQWIAVADGRLNTAAACLDNTSGKPQQRIRARLVPVEHIWDYRRELPTLAETELLVPAGKDRWIEYPVALDKLAPGYVRLDLAADSAEVSWRFARAILPGQVAGGAMSPKKLRRLDNGVTLAFRVSPAQPAYAPEHVLTGVTRPHRSTNLWRSDPGQPLPQWLQLAWPTPQRVAQLQLTFPGHLFREIHAYPPFYRDPQTPRDFTVEAFVNGAWKELLRVTDNYQRHCRYDLASSVTTNQLRVVVHATNGDPSAAIYEVRISS